MNLKTYCIDFQKKHIPYLISSIIFLFIYYPLETILFSVLFGKIFSLTSNIDKNYNLIRYYVGLIIGVYVFLELIEFGKDRVEAHYFPVLEQELRLDIIDIIFNKMEINYESSNNGEIIARLFKIPQYVIYFNERFARWLLPFIVIVIGITIYLFFINFKLGLISLLLFIVYGLSFYFKINSQKKVVVEREKNENILMEEIDDSLNNSFSVITNERIDFEKKRLDKLQKESDNSTINQLNSNVNFKAVLGFFNIILFASLTIYTLYLYKTKQISNAIAISLIILTVFVIKQLRSLSLKAAESATFYGHLSEGDEYISNLVNNTALDGTIDNINIIGNIEFKNVTFSYPGSPQLALDNVSFLVKPGENCAIIGKSASGKTSIIKLLLGFYKTNKGEILIDGVNVENIKRKYLRKNISIVHQNVRLFNRSLIDNIAYGTKYSVPEIKEKLKTLKIMEVFNALPEGLGTLAGKHGENLSGGQKQIIFMLRCYFRENPIILLDEPTSAVDKFHKQYVLEMIDELTKKSTCIIVSHDPSIYKSDMFPKKFGIEKGILKPLL